MECSFPPPLTDDQLSEALDTVADGEVRDHLAGCAYCAARLAEARQAERTLHAGLHRMDCPTPQRLGEYQLKMVDQADARAIARHLKECVRCAGELDDLRAYLGAEPSAPATIQPQQVARLSLGKLFGRVMPPAAVPALRGAGPEPIVIEADGVTVILDVQGSSGGRAIVQGQVVADDLAAWAGALVELRQSGTLQATAVVGDFGGFDLGPVPTVIAELRFTPLRGRMLVVTDLALGI